MLKEKLEHELPSEQKAKDNILDIRRNVSVFERFIMILSKVVCKYSVSWYYSE